MYSYRISEWIVFFFIYCLIGWIWETTYVSLKQKKYVNRGFLHGPYLPIYGSGAIIMLFSTLAVRDKLFLVFIIGGAAATILEYITGAALLAIFKTRYWDYSKRFLNINGHICLKCSIAWCCASVLLVRFIHKPVEKLIFYLPAVLIDEAAAALSVIFLIDLVISVNEALHLRALIISFAESDQVQRRVEESKEKTEKYRLDRKRTIMLYVLQDEIGNLVEQYEDGRHTQMPEESSQNLEGITKLLWDIDNAIETENIMTRNKRLEMAKRIVKRNPAINIQNRLREEMKNKPDIKAFKIKRFDKKAKG